VTGSYLKSAINRQDARSARVRESGKPPFPAAWAPERIEVVDDSAQHAGHVGARSGGGHYAVTLVSKRFEGLNPLQRHRLVYEALGELMKTDIHALSVRALTPEEL
jgi:BolA protein